MESPTPVTSEELEADDKPPKKVKVEPEQEPPKKRGRPKGSGQTPRVNADFRAELAEILALPALGWQIAGNDYLAYCWTIRSQPFAKAVADLAEKNPALKRWLSRMLEGGAYGAVIMTGLALIVPVLAYYGWYPQGMVNPFALSPAEIAEYQEMMGNRQAPPPQDGSIPKPV